MSKYAALGHYLKGQRSDRVPMTFSEVERITGTKLPPSAHKHRPWWSNNARNSVLTRVWLDAGYFSTQVDMEGRKLVFQRQIRTVALPSDQGQRHPAFGFLKGMVRIMPGTDLTKPADPAWAKLSDET